MSVCVYGVIFIYVCIFHEDFIYYKGFNLYDCT